MASSGSIKTAGYEGRYLQFDWSVSSQNVGTNQTVINWELNSYGTAIAGYYLAGSFKVMIDGATVYQSGDRVPIYNGTNLASGTYTFAHGTDGKRSFSAYIEGAIYSSSVNNTASGSWELPTIARASVISFAGDVTLGNKCNIQWTPAHKDYYFRLKYSLGSWNEWSGYTAKPNKTSLHTYTLDTIPLEAANQIPNSKTGTMTATLYTYANGQDALNKVNAIGYSSKTFTVTVPSTEGPTITMALTPVNSLGSRFASTYVQGKSKVKADFTGSAGKYGASIKSYEFHVGTSKYTASPFQSGWLFNSGDLQLKGVVTDSRGYSSTIYKTITVIPYSSPAVVPYAGENSIICARCDANGTLNSSGTYLRVKAARTYSKVEFGGEQKNFCVLGYRYAASGAEFPAEFSTLISNIGSVSDNIDTYLNLGLSVSSSYNVQLHVEDDVGESSTLTFAIPTELVTFMLKPGGKGAAFGKYAEVDNLLDVGFDFRARGKIFVGNEDEQIADFVIESGEKTVGTDVWNYQKWHSGRVDMWCRIEMESGTFNGENSIYYTGTFTKELPFSIYENTAVAMASARSNGVTWATSVAAWSSNVTFGIGRLFGGNSSATVIVQLYVTGRTIET